MQAIASVKGERVWPPENVAEPDVSERHVAAQVRFACEPVVGFYRLTNAAQPILDVEWVNVALRNGYADARISEMAVPVVGEVAASSRTRAALATRKYPWPPPPNHESSF